MKRLCQNRAASPKSGWRLTADGLRPGIDCAGPACADGSLAAGIIAAPALTALSPPPSAVSRGLTLVEVILAVALLSIGAAVLLTAASRCLAVVRVTRDYYEARHVLDLVAIEHPVAVYKVEGQDQLLNADLDNVDYPNGFTVSRHVTRSEPWPDLLVVRTRAFRTDAPTNRAEEVVSFLYYTNEVTGP